VRWRPFRLVRFALRSLATLVVVGLIGWTALVYAYAPELPDTDELWQQPPQPGLTFLASDGEVLARRGAYQARIVTLDEIAPALVDAVRATEDRRFERHFGIDPLGIGRAMLANLRAGGVVQGGSTITQQLAKNLFLDHTRSVERKIREMILAVWLETRLTKDDILTLYLNRVYLGAGAYGVEAAAQRYFGKPAAALNLAESALIAGLLKAPSRFAPTADLDAARARARVVLQAMVDDGRITVEAARAAAAAPATPVTYAEAGIAGWFLDWAARELPEGWQERGSNLVVETTLDRELQAAAMDVVRRTLAGAGAEARVGQAAVVVLDRQGRVRAMVGGSDYRAAPFNRAVDARRQPGSAFKPVVYLAALQDGWRPERRVFDRPIDVGGYRPTNYDDGFQGEMTLADAFARSRNTVSVLLLEEVGRRKVIATARLLGIESPLPADASLALGTGETSLLELAGANVPFVNGGRHVPPHGVVRVLSDTGRPLHAREPEPGAAFLDAAVLRQMQGLFEAVVTRGTGRAADPGDRWVGGKTGTSQGWRDAWFVGFSHDLVIGVWVGNDDNAPMDRVTGGGLPARMFREIMAATPVPQGPERLPEVRTAAAVAEPRAAPAAVEPADDFVGRIIGWFQRNARPPVLPDDGG
jgi:penicillin-binding protein 1A